MTIAGTMKSHLMVNRLTYNLTRSFALPGTRINALMDKAGRSISVLPVLGNNYNLGGLRSAINAVEGNIEIKIDVDEKHLLARQIYRQPDLALDEALDQVKLAKEKPHPNLDFIAKASVPFSLLASIGLGSYYLISNAEEAVNQLFLQATSLSLTLITSLAGIGLSQLALKGLSFIYPGQSSLAYEENAYGKENKWRYFNYFSSTALFPVVEELVHRWAVQGSLMKLVDPVSVLFLQSILFTTVHRNRNGLERAAVFAFGLIYGLSYLATGSLAVPIIVHSANNIIEAVKYRRQA